MVRLRFAPSPTGHLHIGNARAALIPWLFAKKNKGDFFLRMDDTDQSRSKEEYVESITQDINWLGLSYDKFFKQSDRFSRYTEIMEQLVKDGHLYPCFETNDELEFKRKQLLSKKLPPIYDRSSLKLTEEEINEKLAKGEKPHWRFKLNNKQIVWKDLIRGDVSFDGCKLSDPVLIRQDGVFLYTFASVVDDIDTQITHVVRGEDHVTNTAVQIQLFEAITQQPCSIQFAHFSLFVGKDGQALSKRLGSLGLKSMRESGINAMTVNSMLARLGTSQPVEPFYDLHTLSEQFDFSIFSRNPPHFDEDQLKILEKKLINGAPYSFIKDRLPVEIQEQQWDLVKSDLNVLGDIDQWVNIFSDTFTTSITDQADKEFYKQALELLPEEPWNIETWSLWTSLLKKETMRMGKQLFMPLRIALTGLSHGPEMKNIILTLGLDKVKKRLHAVL
ncbi:MAG: glutamate--tRNA ligase [Candidatus Puniceispirillum sp.]|nr:glutamate--tRNA ligase [Candidatus Pelagibacter sp.]MBA4283721.1 glutamate--tRNA ligase [Candidatus Puniceispirillum sp.]